MTDRNRTLLNWAGWIVAVAGLAVEFVGFQTPAMLGGKSILVGSFMVLVGILIAAFARRKASV
ncbi:MAG TPA: hypothetical protein VGT98_11815 [Candidatus Elarobacter sp.]|nr:hypothetical protein [Candidatus Elarobacter sp.]HEV2738411.1 hypothetical protein [Candidatus Elarobacter sp.]